MARVFKVAVDAGHGFNTPGKRSPVGEREWSFNAKVVEAFIAELSQYEGVVIRRFDDPSGKTDIPLVTRTNRANAWGADIFVSFHHNANTGRWGNWTGTETYYWRTSAQGKRLAALLQRANVKAYGLRDRGLKTSNLHITRETKMPSALVEGGFMDSTIDIKKLRDDSVLANAGKYSAQAVAEYAKLKRKTQTKPAPSAKVASATQASVKIQTGGLNNANLTKVIDFLREREWYATVEVDWRKGNPKVTTGGLNATSRKEFEQFMKDNGFYYRVIS